jgi:hypothetical protein
MQDPVNTEQLQSTEAVNQQQEMQGKLQTEKMGKIEQL